MKCPRRYHISSSAVNSFLSSLFLFISSSSFYFHLLSYASMGKRTNDLPCDIAGSVPSLCVHVITLFMSSYFALLLKMTAKGTFASFFALYVLFLVRSYNCEHVQAVVNWVNLQNEIKFLITDSALEGAENKQVVGGNRLASQAARMTAKIAIAVEALLTSRCYSDEEEMKKKERGIQIEHQKNVRDFPHMCVSVYGGGC